MLSVRTIIINGNEDLRIVDSDFDYKKMKPEYAIFHKEHNTTEGKIFVDIYENGYATYGYLVYKKSDRYCPLTHAHENYVWSSRPYVINQMCELFDTEHELARSDIGIAQNDEEGFFGVGILYSKMEKIAKDNPNIFKLGIDKFLAYNKCDPEKE